MLQVCTQPYFRPQSTRLCKQCPDGNVFMLCKWRNFWSVPLAYLSPVFFHLKLTVFFFFFKPQTVQSEACNMPEMHQDYFEKPNGVFLFLPGKLSPLWLSPEFKVSLRSAEDHWKTRSTSRNSPYHFSSRYLIEQSRVKANT